MTLVLAGSALPVVSLAGRVMTPGAGRGCCTESGAGVCWIGSVTPGVRTGGATGAGDAGVALAGRLVRASRNRRSISSVLSVSVGGAAAVWEAAPSLGWAERISGQQRAQKSAR